MLPEIDRIPRIQLKDFRGLFKKAKEALSSSEDRGRGLWIRTTLYYENIPIVATYHPERMRLSLGWNLNGEHHSQTIELVNVPSNLGLSPVIHFLCPYTEEPCRKLYWMNFEEWRSRKSFAHTYSDRNDNKSLRIWGQIGAYDRKLKQIKEHSRSFYRGQFTKSFWRERNFMNKERRLLEILTAEEERKRRQVEELLKQYEEQERRTHG